MRTTIDSKLTLPVARTRPAKQPQAESSTRFDDALRTARPKEAPREEPKVSDAAKTAEAKKKQQAKTQASEESQTPQENVDAAEAEESTDKTPVVSEEAPADSELPVDENGKPVVIDKEENTEAQPRDSAQIVSVPATLSQPAESVETHVNTAATGDVTQSKVATPGSPAQTKPQSSNTGQSPQLQTSSQPAPAQESPPATPQQQALKPEKQDAEPDAKESSQDIETKPAGQTAPTKVVLEKSATGVEKAPVSGEAPPAAPPLQSVAHPMSKSPEAIRQQQANAAQDVRFAEANHPRLVTGIRGELLPGGGAMTLKLDPPELGALQVQVRLQDGAMTATFQTSNDEATRMLSHSLASLKNALESQGISVEKLQVQQAPRDQQTGTNQDQQQSSQWDNPSARQEQQRREMLQRMWRKLAGTEDPLDLVA